MARIWGMSFREIARRLVPPVGAARVRTRGSWPSIIGVELGTSWLPGRSISGRDGLASGDMVGITQAVGPLENRRTPAAAGRGTDEDGTD